MSKKLIAYFSATKTTEKAAKALAQAARADLFEIAPVVPYTRGDLDWMDQKSRSTLEMKDPSARPQIAGQVDHMEDYDVVFLGFPIWWHREPRIIDTFLEQYDFAGKTIVLFATSGGSGFGETVRELRAIVPPQTRIIEGKLLNGEPSVEKLKAWIQDLGV